VIDLAPSFIVILGT